MDDWDRCCLDRNQWRSQGIRCLQLAVNGGQANITPEVAKVLLKELGEAETSSAQLQKTPNPKKENENGQSVATRNESQ
jgi:hypothetical protein